MIIAIVIVILIILIGVGGYYFSTQTEETPATVTTISTPPTSTSYTPTASTSVTTASIPGGTTTVLPTTTTSSQVGTLQNVTGTATIDTGLTSIATGGITLTPTSTVSTPTITPTSTPVTTITPTITTTPTVTTTATTTTPKIDSPIVSSVPTASELTLAKDLFGDDFWLLDNGINSFRIRFPSSTSAEVVAFNYDTRTSSTQLPWTIVQRPLSEFKQISIGSSMYVIKSLSRDAAEITYSTSGGRITSRARLVSRLPTAPIVTAVATPTISTVTTTTPTISTTTSTTPTISTVTSTTPTISTTPTTTYVSPVSTTTVTSPTITPTTTTTTVTAVPIVDTKTTTTSTTAAVVYPTVNTASADANLANTLFGTGYWNYRTDAPYSRTIFKFVFNDKYECKIDVYNESGVFVRSEIKQWSVPRPPLSDSKRILIGTSTDFMLSYVNTTTIDMRYRGDLNQATLMLNLPKAETTTTTTISKTTSDPIATTSATTSITSTATAPTTSTTSTVSAPTTTVTTTAFTSNVVDTPSAKLFIGGYSWNFYDPATGATNIFKFVFNDTGYADVSIHTNSGSVIGKATYKFNIANNIVYLFGTKTMSLTLISADTMAVTSNDKVYIAYKSTQTPVKTYAKLITDSPTAKLYLGGFTWKTYDQRSAAVKSYKFMFTSSSSVTMYTYDATNKQLASSNYSYKVSTNGDVVITTLGFKLQLTLIAPSILLMVFDDTKYMSAYKY